MYVCVCTLCTVCNVRLFIWINTGVTVCMYVRICLDKLLYQCMYVLYVSMYMVVLIFNVCMYRAIQIRCSRCWWQFARKNLQK